MPKVDAQNLLHSTLHLNLRNSATIIGDCMYTNYREDEDGSYYMSYSLNSEKGGYIGDYMGDGYGVYQGGYEEFRLQLILK